VKVLDVGLARTNDPTSAALQGPTVTIPMAVLGTPASMRPEQAQGNDSRLEGRSNPFARLFGFGPSGV
jgi:hypothetical protein